MSMNKYGGVNDMPDGFTKTPLGKRVYALWFSMLRRCYDYKQLGRKKDIVIQMLLSAIDGFILKTFMKMFKNWTDIANG